MSHRHLSPLFASFLAGLACVTPLSADAQASPGEPPDAEAPEEAGAGETPAELAQAGVTPIPVEIEVDRRELAGATVIEEEETGEAVIEVKRLTPVMPEPREDAPHRAYQLYWELDMPILGVGGALAAARIFRTGEGSAPASCLISYGNDGSVTRNTSCDPDDINAFDRWAAGRYDQSWSAVSDYAALALVVGPPVFFAIEEGLLVMLNDMVVVYQSGLLAVAASGLATLGGARARPFVYGTEAPEDVRTGGNGALSFVSSHTSLAFALATATFWTVERRHGGSVMTWTVFGLGLAAASLVGVARVLAGSHFPTDVGAGAVVGISMGTLVPILHGSPVRVSASPRRGGAQGQVAVEFE